jgi:hypothetical protein
MMFAESHFWLATSSLLLEQQNMRVIKNRAANMSLMMHTKIGLDKKVLLFFLFCRKILKEKISHNGT